MHSVVYILVHHPPRTDKRNTKTNTIMAFIIQRGATWYARWRENGKTITKTTSIPVDGAHGQTAKAAKKQAQMIADSMEAAAKGAVSLEKALDAVRAVAVAAGHGKPVPTVRELLDAVPRNTSRSSENNRKRAHDTFLAFLGADADLRADKITAETCTAYIVAELKRISRGTVVNNRSFLSIAFKRGVAEGTLERNPWELVSVAKLAKTVKAAQAQVQRQPFTMAEIQFLLSPAFPAPWRDMVAVSWYCYGLRLSDVCLMKWSDIDRGKGVITLTEQKTSKARQIPICGDLAARLDVMQKSALPGDEYLFPNMAARYKHAPGYISTQFTGLLRAVGIISADDTGAGKGDKHRISVKSFHSIRHAVVSCLRSDARFTADVVRDAVGHDSEQVERGYFTATLAQRAAVGDALADAVKSAS